MTGTASPLTPARRVRDWSAVAVAVVLRSYAAQDDWNAIDPIEEANSVWLGWGASTHNIVVGRAGRRGRPFRVD